jgi:hypothetical protein
MDKEMDKGKQKEAMDPIMMEEDQIKKIMEKVWKDTQQKTLPI